MNKPAAIAANLVDVRNIAAHKCVRLEIHVPAEQAGIVLDAFGWPTAVNPVPVAIARLEPEKAVLAAPLPDVDFSRDSAIIGNVEPVKERRPFSSLPLSQQAALRCNDKNFWMFINEWAGGNKGIESSDGLASFVRSWCGVKSRADIKAGVDSGYKWERLNASYDAWLRERAYR